MQLGRPAQTPPVHSSGAVQVSPSSQAVPSGLLGFEHWPVDGLHVPATWHWSSGVQTTGFEPTQTPPEQVSVCVKPSPSLHGVASPATVHTDGSPEQM